MNETCGLLYIGVGGRQYWQWKNSPFGTFQNNTIHRSKSKIQGVRAGNKVNYLRFRWVFSNGLAGHKILYYLPKKRKCIYFWIFQLCVTC